ncbi:MAG: IclR family transcriptional regulator [Alphaproteobacteria bacterium]|nr:IclR family transcriptional regulator [Alphaproteobacteria bacterium]
MSNTDLKDNQADTEKTGTSIKRVPAVRRAAGILWELADRPTPMNLSQISRAVGIIPSTCLHILRELVSARLVSYDVSSKTYQLGSGITDLAKSALRLNDFAELAKSRLQTIANRFSMTATATSKIDDQHLALVAFANPPDSISLNVTLGGRVPLMSGASGRCFAAFGNMTERQIKQNFAKVKWVRPITYDDWMSQVEQTRVDGFSEDREGFVKGVSAIALPVFMPDGSVTHTIGVYAITAQLEAIDREELISALRQTAKDINHRMSR